ncbi:hypothetical protein DZK27_10615 [Rhodobacteraceae bacterium 63075]|nr:hypothetical protein DZK27_10615 [Rhodobacteraceae bacterium 63075]
MTTISLTSIPPRFDQLGPVLESLLAQSIAATVMLQIPQSYARFPGPVTLPALPEGVTVHRTPRDYGPATKLLGALEAGTRGDVVICDDDCLYAPDWAGKLFAARRPGTAVSAHPYSVKRLRRVAQPPYDLIAQGFAGVLLEPPLLGDDILDPPREAFGVDDIWISAHLALARVPIVAAPEARAHVAPQSAAAPLQDAHLNGRTRAASNTACLDYLTARYGLWPRSGH